MTISLHSALARSLQALTLTFATALVLAGCSAPADTAGSDTTNESPSAQTDSSNDSSSGTPTLPADLPENIFITDGQLVSAEGSAPRWQITKTMQGIDQARVAVDANVKSYNFVIDDFEDGDSPTWLISNDVYTVSVDVRDGDPLLVTYIIEER